MPNFEEHCKQTYIRYGVTGELVHLWMDELVSIYGPMHRNYRHDPNQKLPKFCIDEYGEELAYNIMFDHLVADKNTAQGLALVQAQYQHTALKEKLEQKEREQEEHDKRISVLVESLEHQIKELRNDLTTMRGGV